VPFVKLQDDFWKPGANTQSGLGLNPLINAVEVHIGNLHKKFDVVMENQSLKPFTVLDYLTISKP